MTARALQVCLILIVVLVPRSVFAQAQVSPPHVADAADLRKAVNARVTTEQENRRAVIALLEREDVKSAARRVGLDIKKAKDHVALMEGSQLDELARFARTPEAPPRRANSITISVTTLLLLLILIVLIVD